MLKLTSIVAPSAVLVAFTLTAGPAFAQERSHGRQNPSGEQSSGRTAERAQPRSESPRQQGAAPRVESRQETPRAQSSQRVETPRAQQPNQVISPRGGNSGGGRYDDRRAERYAVPRHDVIAPRANVYAPRYSPRYSPRVYVPGYYYRPYVFRPHFSLGFGIYAGYPVPYTYSYPYPIAVYGYGAPRNEVMINPGAMAYGGVALEITPPDADVYVDGQYAGHVEDFDGTRQPLTLTAGTHRIDVQAPGFRTMTFDVGIQAGQVMPYRGDLQRY
jgi:hypothetical protein